MRISEVPWVRSHLRAEVTGKWEGSHRKKMIDTTDWRTSVKYRF